MKRFFTSAIFILLLGCVYGQNFTVDNISYVVLKDNTAQVAYSGGYYYDYVTIPSSVSYAGSTYTVASIGEGAFSNSTLLTGVTVPGSVTYIAKKAFYNCKSMAEIKIMGSIDSIGNNAFENCTSLKSFSLPFSVGTTTIGDYAFYNCNKMTNISLPNSVISIGIGAMGYCQSLTGFDIPNPIKKISGGMFMLCNNLISITIPEGVTTIENDAFASCTNLKTAIIPSTVTRIENNAFYTCSSLSDVTLPASITYIGLDAFKFCSGMNKLRVLNPKPILVSSDCFSGVPYTATLYVPDGTEAAYKKTSGWDAFFTIQGSSTVFTASDGLIYQTLNANNVTVLGYDNHYSFFGNIFINAKVTHDADTYNVIQVSGSAFTNWNILAKMDLPASVVAIGERAFENCPGLTSVNIPGSLLKIEKSTFKNCVNLNTVNLPKTITVIGDSAFAECGALSEITLPASLATVGSGSFADCHTLPRIHFSTEIKTIGDNAFYQCSNLAEVHVEVPNPVNITLGKTIFTGVPFATCRLFVPIGSKQLYALALQWGNFVQQPVQKKFTNDGYSPLTNQVKGFDNIIEFDYAAYYKLYPEFNFTSAHEFITALPTTLTNKITVCPSVVKESFKVNGTNEAATLQISDMNGKTVAKQTVCNSATVPVHQLQKGTYIVTILSGRAISRHRIIKE